MCLQVPEELLTVNLPRKCSFKGKMEKKSERDEYPHHRRGEAELTLWRTGTVIWNTNVSRSPRKHEQIQR